MGRVYEAWSPVLDRKVALKVLDPGGPVVPEDTARFATEARAVARLDHPAIVAVHDAGAERGRPYLVMELVAGEALSARLARRGPLEPVAAAALVRDLARAVAHAHERGVLHRDLKPGNVLLDAEGRPRLTDFGLARVAGPWRGLTRTGDVLGTPAYMAPEQALGHHRAVDARTDLYGLGAILYEALTGRPPFAGDSFVEVVQKVVETRATAPSVLRPGLDPALEAVCARAMAKTPADRPASAADLAAELEAWIAGRAGARRPGGGRRWLVLAAGVAVGLLLGVAATAAVALSLRPAPADASPSPGPPPDSPTPRPPTEAPPPDEDGERGAAGEDGGGPPAPDVGRRRAAELLARAGGLPLGEPRSAELVEAALKESRAPEILSAAGYFYLLAGRRDRARQLGEAAADAEPGFDGLSVLHDLWLDEHPNAEGVSPPAREASRRAEVHGLTDPFAHYAAGRVAEEAGDLEAALRHYDAAVEGDPQNTSAYLGRARCRVARGEPRAALPDCNAARARRWTRHRALALRAEARLLAGDPAGAFTDVSHALDLHETGRAHLVRGRVRRRIGDPREALAEADAAEALGAPPAEVAGLRGEALLAIGDLSRALPHLDAAVAGRPDAPSYRVARCRARTWTGDLEGARSDATVLVERWPDDARGHAALAAVEATAGRLEAAEDAISRAIARAPADPELRRVRAQVRRDRGDREGALADVEAHAELAPDDAGAAGRLAELRLETGDVEGAHAAIERAVTLAGAGAARRLRPRLLLLRAEVHAALGDEAKAEADLRHILAAYPDTPAAEAARGRLGE